MPTDPQSLEALDVPGLHWLTGIGASIVSLGYLAFWIWMLVDCARKDPDRYIWIWIVLFVPLGSLIYFFVRWLPNNDFRMPRALRQMARGREIERLEIAAQQIGNAHQHIQLGDVLYEVGKHDRAKAAYAVALAKDGNNTQALWGAAQVDYQLKDYATSRDRLQKLLAIDPQYKFGDVSLLFGKALYQTGDRPSAKEHLEKHIVRWRHPEALFLLATIEAEAGNSDEARAHLQAMVMDINGCPRAIARKYGIWKSKARRMFKKLPPRVKTG